MEKRNYQKELDQIIAENTTKNLRPKLLLHVCCAPCSSYVLEYLSDLFEITVYYYNPNIGDKAEYEKRLAEVERFITEAFPAGKIAFIAGEYNPFDFYEAVRGFEQLGEGSERCRKCFALRLSKTAQLASRGGFDCFTTTLTISPLKNASVLNEEGERAAEIWGVPFLPSDFKKRDGYKRSIELSAEYGLYRQNYCGCEFSRKEASEREKQR